MEDKKVSVKRKLLRAGGWQVVKRGARSLPFGGTFIVLALVGSDIRKKGIVRGLVNSGLDAIPVFGLAKNAVELVRGDFLPDRPKKEKVK